MKTVKEKLNIANPIEKKKLIKILILILILSTVTPTTDLIIIIH
jgi:hypothetical protein